MKTSEALAAISKSEATAKLTAAGYKSEPCPACSGAKIFAHGENTPNWRREACMTCEGQGVVWHAPLVR